jgi:glycosyltransferase involved in cell wall biosynthesis/predicted SAM-dependent methyltransferase
MFGKELSLKDCKILVVSRANACDDGELYFQNLDGNSLDGIAKEFKEMEILAPVHKKGIHPTYEIYKNYTYKFQSSNVYITDIVGIKSYSRNLFRHLVRLYYEIKFLREKIKYTDFVYVFMSAIKAAVAVKFCLKYKKPFVVYLGGDWEEDAKFQYRWNKGILKLGRYPYIKLCAFLERWVMKNSPVKIVNSAKLYKRYANFSGYIEETRPLVQIQPSDFFYREDTCVGDVIRVLSVAAVIPRKGLEYLVEGFSQAEKEIPNMELHLVGAIGDEFYREKLEDIIYTNRIDSKVHWHGYVPNGPELLEFYRKSDIFILSSLSEGFPRVIWEAMSQGVPIIATRLDNIYEKIGSQNLVHFVSPRSSREIANGIVKIVREAEYRKRLIKKGYGYVREIFRETSSEQFIRIVRIVNNAQKNDNLQKMMKEFYKSSDVYIERMACKDNDKWSKIFKNYALKVSRFCRKGDLILDLGCGGGWSSLAISKVTHNTVVGVDLLMKSVLLGVAKKEKVKVVEIDILRKLMRSGNLNEGEVYFTEADCLKLPFEDGSFDVVTSHSLIEHLYPADVALKEMLRVCKRKGILIISAPNMLSPLRATRLFLQGLKKGEFHPDGKIFSFFKCILFCLKKWGSKKLNFSYRKPIISYDKFLGSDYDAVFLVNPFDLEKFGQENNLKIINLVDTTSRFGKMVKFILPKLAGGIFFVAVKQ